MRSIAPPFVVAAPAGARVRTRLLASEDDAGVLVALGRYLGTLAGRDLARRCCEGHLDAPARAASRRWRKQALTAECSSRWAGTITRTSEDAWQLARRNLMAERSSLEARVTAIRRRLAVPVGARMGRVRGYATRAERYEKQRRAQHLTARLEELEARLAEGRVPICRGGRRRLRTRHHLDEAAMSETQWRAAWEAARLFIRADGEADKNWGNETIRFHPDERWLEVKLPDPLAPLANRPHGRYRLSCSVSFSHRADEVAAQAASGAIRYDISFDPAKKRWYLDASWRLPARAIPELAELRSAPVLAVDLNAGHLAAYLLDPAGNPSGLPLTIPLRLAGLPASTRDGRLRAALSELFHLAKANGARAIVIEDLDFKKARTEGKERSGRRPSRGRRGRGFRRLVAGIPTACIRDRLTQMAANKGLFVVTVDPAYTSRWGAEHWLGALKEISDEASGHHAAALVIGRRGLGQRARRRGRCDRTRPEDRERRATNSAVRPRPGVPGLSGQRNRKPGDREARGQPHRWRKTRPAKRASSGEPGDPGPFGATRRAGLSFAQCLGTVSPRRSTGRPDASITLDQAADHPDELGAFVGEGGVDGGRSRQRDEVGAQARLGIVEQRQDRASGPAAGAVAPADPVVGGDLAAEQLIEGDAEAPARAMAAGASRSRPTPPPPASSRRPSSS